MKRRKKQMPTMGLLSGEYADTRAIGIIIKVILVFLLAIAFYLNSEM